MGRGWFFLVVGLGAVSGRAQVDGCDFADEGSRMVAVKRDAVKDLHWAVMVDCAHPEWPAKLVPLAGKDVVAVSAQTAAVIKAPAAVVNEGASLVVRAGETVRVWSNNGMVKMEMTGVAQESGGVGKRIRVRMLRQGMESIATEKVVTGLVAGLGSVEMGR